MRFASALKISLVLLSVNLPAYSASWVPLGADNRGNAWHVDMASLSGSPEAMSAWNRVDFPQPVPHFQTRAPIQKAFILSTTDCGQRRTEIKAMGFLDPDGSIVNIYHHGSERVEWPPYAQRDLLESAMALVCSGKGSVP